MIQEKNDVAVVTPFYEQGGGAWEKTDRDDLDNRTAAVLNRKSMRIIKKKKEIITSPRKACQ